MADAVKIYGVFERGNGCGCWHLHTAYGTFEQAARQLAQEHVTGDEQEAEQNYRVAAIDVQEA